MQKIVKNVCVGLVCAFSLFSSVSAQTFSDVGETFPHYDAVEWGGEKNIIQGFDDGTFHPNNKITRAEFVKVVLLQKYTQEEVDAVEIPKDAFFDINSSDWFYKYIYFAKEKGVINGYDDNSFKPNEEINFAEISKIVCLTFLEDVNFEDFVNEHGSNEQWFNRYTRSLQALHDVSVSYGFDYALTRAEFLTVLWKIKNVKKEHRLYVYPDKILRYGKSYDVNVEGETFEHLYADVYIDSNNTYLDNSDVGLLVLGKKTETAEYLGDYLLLDSDVFYVNGDISVVDVERDSFKSLGNDYYSDGKKIFFKNTEFEDIDIETFNIIDNYILSPYSKDKNNIYINGKILDGVDSKTFKYLENSYFIDKNGSYFADKKMEIGIDLETFKNRDGFFVDKNNVYYQGNIFHGLNPKNFVVFSDSDIYGNRIDFLKDEKLLFLVYREITLLEKFNSSLFHFNSRKSLGDNVGYINYYTDDTLCYFTSYNQDADDKTSYGEIDCSEIEK